jgi:branched-chain amino acid transport system substrate-binding protein
MFQCRNEREVRMKKHHGPRKLTNIMTIVIALLLAFTLRPAHAAQPINVGFTTDFSGNSASQTMQEAPVVEMVVKKINASGGINGRPINLIVQDNGSDPARAVGNAKMFKEQYNCKVIIAGVTSSVCIALKNWADHNHVPIIQIDPQSDKLWVKSGKSWVFRTETPASPRVDAILARLKKLGYTRVAFEGTTLAWGTDTLAVVKEKAPSYGVKVVAEVLTEPKTKDLTIQARKLKDSGAQALIATEYDAETAGLARAMSAIGWKPYVIHTSAATLTAGIALSTPELFNGWETIQQIDPAKPLMRKIWADTREFSGKNVVEDEKGARAWDAINLLVEALRLSGNPDDATAIRDAFYKIRNYERAMGPKGGKGGFVVGKNHLLNEDELIFSTVKSGKMIAAK